MRFADVGCKAAAAGTETGSLDAARRTPRASPLRSLPACVHHATEYFRGSGLWAAGAAADGAARWSTLANRCQTARISQVQVQAQIQVHDVDRREARPSTRLTWGAERTETYFPRAIRIWLLCELDTRGETANRRCSCEYRTRCVLLHALLLRLVFLTQRRRISGPGEFARDRDTVRRQGLPRKVKVLPYAWNR